MKKTELFNQISPELIAKTKLKPGDKVVYKVHGITPHPMDPTKWAIPAARNVPPTDEIYDPIKEEYASIGAVRSVDADGTHRFHEIYFFGNQGGHLILNGGIAADQEIHSYLQLCNYNGSNPDRDVSKEIIFEVVDEAVKADKEVKKRSKKREALNIAADLSEDEIRNIVAALGQDDTDKISVLRNKMEELADVDPENFLGLISNKQLTMKAALNRAVSKGVIIFDAEQSKFTWPNGEVILVVSRTTGGDNIEELLAFCVANQKGEKVFQTIQSKSRK
jgi:hypothetical protein